MAIRPRRKSSHSGEKTGSQFGIASPEQLRQLINDKLPDGAEVLSFVAKTFGIRVEYLPLDSESSGKLTFDKTLDQWKITINSLHHPKRQRFTFAHELAHFFLHKDKQSNFSDTVFFRSENVRSNIEFEANNFAGALLMPKAEFVDFIRNESNRIEDISERFNVSAMAVKVRADVIRGGNYEY